MLWLLLAILAHFMYSITGVIDGVVLKNYVRNPVNYLLITKFLLGIFALILILFTGIEAVSLKQFLFAILAGVFVFYALLPYYKAVSFEEISRVIPLWGFGPIFALFLARIFVNEILTYYQFIGFIFLALGGFIISAYKIKGVFKLSKAFFLMLLADLLIAAYFVTTKFVFLSYDFITNFIFIRIGILLVILFLVIITKRGFKFINIFLKVPKKGKTLIVSQVLLDFVALIFIGYAIILQGPVSIINALTGAGSVFVFIIAVLLSIKFPKLLREDLSKKIVIQKLIAITLIVLGIYFVNIP